MSLDKLIMKCLTVNPINALGRWLIGPIGLFFGYDLMQSIDYYGSGIAFDFIILLDGIILYVCVLLFILWDGEHARL